VLCRRETSFLNAHGIRIFDYPQFALPLRDRVRERVQALVEEQGVTIEHNATLGLICARAHQLSFPPPVLCNCNGHSWLARKLTREGIDFAMATTPSSGSRTGPGHDGKHKFFDPDEQTLLRAMQRPEFVALAPSPPHAAG
jgi:hypothetical protein